MYDLGSHMALNRHDSFKTLLARARFLCTYDSCSALLPNLGPQEAVFSDSRSDDDGLVTPSG